jgi:hypothetical protein
MRFTRTNPYTWRSSTRPRGYLRSLRLQELVIPRGGLRSWEVGGIVSVAVQGANSGRWLVDHSTPTHCPVCFSGHLRMVAVKELVFDQKFTTDSRPQKTSFLFRLEVNSISLF